MNNILSLFSKVSSGLNDLLFLFLSIILFGFLWRKKKRADVEFVWTPQHAPQPYSDHYAFNFENGGWQYNQSKGCYEIWMKQYGYFDESSCDFVPAYKISGGHKIMFYTKEAYEKWRTDYPTHPPQ